MYGCKLDSDGITMGRCGHNEARFHVQEYTKKELYRAEIESTQAQAEVEPKQEASNVAEFLNEN